MDTGLDLREHGGADAYLRDCASRSVLDVLANKWTTLAMIALRPGPMRFGELRRRLDGVTQKMLTQTLRILERDGLVSRTVFPTIPPRVDYELTELGTSAVALLDGVKEWSECHYPEIIASRKAYDERASQEIEPVRT